MLFFLNISLKHFMILTTTNVTNQQLFICANICLLFFLINNVKPLIFYCMYQTSVKTKLIIL